MKCPECATPLPNVAQFCHHCGLQLTANRAAVAERSSGRRAGRSALAEEQETLLWQGTFSAKGLVHGWLLAVLISVVMVVGGVMAGAPQVYWLAILAVLAVVWVGLLGLVGFHKLNVHYELTDQRLIHRSGILRRHTDRIELIDIDDVSHEQGIIERMVGVGTIVISSSDRTHPLIDLPGIDRVDEVAALVDDARRRERIRRGIHVEAI